MIKLRFALAIGCLALAACTPSNPVANNTVDPPPRAAPGNSLAEATVMDEKALYAVEAAYNVPAHAYVTADGKGLLNSALKARVKPLLVQAYAALKTARAAYATGNARTFTEAKASVERLAAEASAILPKPSG